MRILLATTTLCLSACVPNVGQEASAGKREISYSCSNGESVSVRFNPESNTAVLTRAGDSIELTQQANGADFVYSNGTTTIRGKTEGITVEIGRMAAMGCKVVR